MQKAFMVAAGLKYDTCTPEEMKEHIQLYDKDLWQLLMQVEVSKWNHELVEELRKAPYSGVFYKVCCLNLLYNNSHLRNLVTKSSPLF